MRRILLAATALVAFSAAAFAADMPVKAYKAAPAPAPLFNWSGFYIGGHIGGAWDNVDWGNVSLTGESIKTDASSFIGGGQLGYNWQLGQWVVGVEATLSGASLKDTVTSAVNGAVTYTNKIDVIGTVVARLGYAWDRSLFYIDGGYAYARLRTSGFNAGIPDSFSLRDYEDGWTIGGGWEYAWQNNWIFGIDYKHIDLGNINRSGTTAVGLPFTISRIDPTIDMVTVRLSYKFGDWGKGPVVAKY